MLALRWLEWHRRGGLVSPRLVRAEPVIDLILLVGLTYASGGAVSQLRKAFFVLPLAAAFRLRPAHTAGWALAAVASYLALALPHPASGADESLGVLITHGMYLAWVGAAATLLSAVLARRAARITALADERGELVAQALAAEERERRRLAEVLHDEAVQNLLLARQELAEARRGDPAALDRAHDAVSATVEQLRGEISELHPHLLDHAGLAAALGAVAEQQARRVAPG
jgi:two-component system NarL family sensor kinase